MLLSSTYLCLPVPFPLLKTNLGCRYSLLQGVPPARCLSILGSRQQLYCVLEPALPFASPDLLLQSWAAAAHLPQVLGHQWRGYVHHTLDPRFVPVRTTPTPPPLPRRRHPGAFLRHGRSTSVCGVFLKKTEIPRRFLKKTAIPIIKMGNSADLEIDLPLLRRRGHFYIEGG